MRDPNAAAGVAGAVVSINDVEAVIKEEPEEGGRSISGEAPQVEVASNAVLDVDTTPPPKEPAPEADKGTSTADTSKPAERRKFKINTPFERKAKSDHDYPNNRVSTTRYTCLTFLPKNLFF